ncbi:hypothetical protein DFJ74DRAFT_708873 [Hyaloraphidium curvatum]|nr:hypothetical protein DFJ74DRAFT_708873 [Hyaloraphidium curvatum]
MFEKLKRSRSRHNHQSEVNGLRKKLAAALPSADLEADVDITSNSALQHFVDSLPDRAAAEKITPLVKEMQALNLDRKKLCARLIDEFQTRDLPSQNSRKHLEAYLAQSEAAMKDEEEYFGQAGSGGFEQINLLEQRIELVKDMIALLPENYEFRGTKYVKAASSAGTASPTSAVPTPSSAPAPAPVQTAPVPPSPVSAGTGPALVAVASPIAPSPIVTSYVN